MLGLILGAIGGYISCQLTNDHDVRITNHHYSYDVPSESIPKKSLYIAPSISLETLRKIRTKYHPPCKDFGPHYFGGYTVDIIYNRESKCKWCSYEPWAEFFREDTDQLLLNLE